MSADDLERVEKGRIPNEFIKGEAPDALGWESKIYRAKLYPLRTAAKHLMGYGLRCLF